MVKFEHRTGSWESIGENRGNVYRNYTRQVNLPNGDQVVDIIIKKCVKYPFVSNQMIVDLKDEDFTRYHKAIYFLKRSGRELSYKERRSLRFR